MFAGLIASSGDQIEAGELAIPLRIHTRRHSSERSKADHYYESISPMKMHARAGRNAPVSRLYRERSRMLVISITHQRDGTHNFARDRTNNPSDAASLPSGTEFSDGGYKKFVLD
jgi:hypothetical protein